MLSTWKQRLQFALGTCFGFGYSPIFPGTAGALWGIAIYVPLEIWLPAEPWLSLSLAVSLVLVCVVTVVLSPWAEKYFQEKDSSKFVTDEVAGFLLTVLLFHPTGNVWTIVFWAFPVTRVIDMIKIPPAKRLEKLPGGWGVLADDLLGSVYAALLLHGIYYFYPTLF